MKTNLNYLLIICVIAFSSCNQVNTETGADGKSNAHIETVAVKSLIGLWKLYKTESGPSNEREIKTEKGNVYLNLQASGDFEYKDKKGNWVLADSKSSNEIGSLLVLISEQSYPSEIIFEASIVEDSETEYLILSELVEEEDMYFVRQK